MDPNPQSLPAQFGVGVAVNLVSHGLLQLATKFRDRLQAVDFSAVPTPVLATALQELPRLNGEVQAEYFYRIIRSSVASNPRDDRAKKWLEAIGSMSVYEVLAHCTLYLAARPVLLSAEQPEWLLPHNWHLPTFQIPYEEFVGALQLTEGERREEASIVEDAMIGLTRRGFLHTWGAGEDTVSQAARLTYALSLDGVQLLAWGSGYGSSPVSRFVDPGSDWSPPETVPRIPKVTILQKALRRQ